MMSCLFDTAHQCILAADPDDKIHLTHQAVQAWQAGELVAMTTTPALAIATPGQPKHLRLVCPKDVPRRRLGTADGQAALLHALTHIEFNAINLAWDAVYRFRELPKDFYDDWIQVAEEESQHFVLLREELNNLGYDYGDLPAHNGLWETALDTADDPLTRMALVPRVLEARGLDATPPIIAKLQLHQLDTIAKILQIILRDEIGHVAAGSKWFVHLCEQRNLIPEHTFREVIHKQFKGRLKGVFNVEARLAAGFTQSELDTLKSLFG